MKLSVNKFYIFNFFYHIAYSALAALLIVALQKNGVTILDFTLAESIGWVSSFILEVPSGMLADYFGRKKTIIITCIFELIAIIFYFFSHNFLIVLFGELCFAISECCMSGTFNAWFFSPANTDKTETRKKISRNGNACLLGNLTGGVIGGLLTAVWQGWLWIFCFCIVTVCLIICLSMPDVESEKKISSFLEGLKEMVRPIKSMKIIFTNKPALIMLPEMWLLGFFLAGPNVLWQTYFLSSLQKTASFISIMWILIQIVQILANLCIEKVKKITEKYIFISIISLFFIAISMFLMSYSYGSYLGVIVFAVFIFFNFIQGPILGTYTAELFEEKDRATCFSIMSLIGSVISAFGLSVGGVISDKYGLLFVYKYAGIALFIVFILHCIFTGIMKNKSKLKGYKENEI